MGAALLRQAMTTRAELDLTSYDRFFPSQDFLPRAGFGNLIVAPRELDPRSATSGDLTELADAVEVLAPSFQTITLPGLNLTVNAGSPGEVQPGPAHPWHRERGDRRTRPERANARTHERTNARTHERGFLGCQSS